jgi:Putative peptidoglycan binding domain
MKKLTSLLIGCSLALAGAALAQQPVEQQSPSTSKHAPEKTHATQAQPGANAAKPQEKPAKQTGATKEHGTMNEPGTTNEPGAEKGRKTHAGRESATAPETNVSGQGTGGAANEPGAGKGRKARAHEESANAPATGTDVSGHAAGMPTHGGKQQAEEQKRGVKQPAAPAGAAANAAPSVSAAGQQNAQANAGAKAKKPEPQQVQQIKAQHANFRAQPKPEQVPAVTFNQNYRIERSDRWQGPQYEVFRSYHPERHDEGWYRSHYNRVELIGGGYYYWNNGYWYPAWGYNSSAEYYAYDGPIYVGQRAEPPDQVIADVQAELQQMGYYKGEVDGLLGPLTREALTAYQADQGLTTTAAIDQPTLDSLGMG